jgi:hypothetical protein
MPALDLIVSVLWIGVLAVVLLVQAVYAWLGHRHWARSAREAARLAAATRPTVVESTRQTAPDLKVIPGGLAHSADDPRRQGTDVPAEA